MKRIVEPELLDELPPGDPLAVRSRRDLCRVNVWMRNHSIMVETLRNHLNGRAPEQIIELGAGDGNFLLQVAQNISAPWKHVRVTLLDRKKTVTPQTLASFTSLGWLAEAVTADVFDWSPAGKPAEVIITNLFLHHFYDMNLARLLRSIAGHARLFIAIEPRRAPVPWLCSRLLWAIGCNRVTRHDAAVSVRAGFAGAELSACWPDKQHWRLTEHPAGPFSHLFIAQRTG
ncbi:MAG: methyltransferase domain-containing protein [Verrucomicrobiia bacterium]